MINQSVIPVILSGGAGTRLWPLSRQLRPKQFLNVHGETSMFSQTLARVSGEPFGPPMVVCNDQHRFLVAEELRSLEITARDIILEPAARNTAPAIATAALRILEQEPNAIMLVLPSDHVIEDNQAFRDGIKIAVDLAAVGHLVSFGLVPSHPETGYGYIRRGEVIGDNSWQVERFVEKPSMATAKDYLAEGGYYWNAGIFVFSAQTYIDELKLFQPDILEAARQALQDGASDLDFYRLDRTAFESAPAISVDYAIMEKTERAAVVPLATAWNDIGSWASLWDLGAADSDGNVTEGNAVMLDARNNYIRSEKPLIAALGVDGLVIVATDDTVLIIPKDRAQDVKDVVAALEASDREETISHTRVYRPWGYYQNLDSGDGFLVKQIAVKPGAKLSLQHHRHRAEHWVVVEGVARVTNGADTFDLTANQSTFIPLGVPHRLENPTDQPLRLIEVQSGDYIGEDDIVRLDDTYGRH